MDNLGLGLGAGVIEPWPTDYVQENATGQSSTISNVSWEKLSNSPNTVYKYDYDLYDRELGEYVQTGIEMYTSSVTWNTSHEALEYIQNINVTGAVFDWDEPERPRFALPYNNMFYGCDASNGGQQVCYLYNIGNYGPYTRGENPRAKYSIGGTTSYKPYYMWNVVHFSYIATEIDGANYVGWITWSYNNNENPEYCAFIWYLINQDKIINLLGNFTRGEVPRDENPQTGPASLPIGWAADVVNKYKDEVVIPDAPTLGVSTAGFVNVYEITPNALQGLAAALFRNYEDVEIPEFPDTTQNVNDILKLGFKVIGVNSAVLTNINKQTLDSKYLDYIIDCHIIPVRPNVALPTNLSIGGRTIYKQGNPVLQDYIDFNCGSISIGARYNNQFDFTNVSFKLYLPFIGFVTLNPSYCSPVDASKPVQLGVKYRFNVIDGSCLAFVTSSVLGYGTNSIIGIYSGSCCVHMPITGSNYNSMISGMLNIASIGAQAVKNPLSLLGNAGNLVDSVDQATHPSFESSNSYNASSAFMGVRYPYLVIERPTQAMPQNFFEREGARLNARKRLGDLKGYAKCINADIHFAGPDNDEKEEIKALLESGIYL